MEKLEEISDKVSIKVSEEREERYEGLYLIEEKSYKSGTSIKYWM
jgi:hypothetical protein